MGGFEKAQGVLLRFLPQSPCNQQRQLEEKRLQGAESDEGRLVLLRAVGCDEELLAVDITFRLDFRTGILSILALLFNPERACILVFGTLHLALDGTELEVLSLGNL